MVRMTVLGSGSRGNSTMVSSARTRILVDAGLSCRELFKRMAQAGEDPSRLDAILITHEHQDHVQGLSVVARKLGIPVYFTEATHRAWVRWMTPRKRLSYGEWLAARQAEAAARHGEASVFSAPSTADPRDQSYQPVPGQDHHPASNQDATAVGVAEQTEEIEEPEDSLCGDSAAGVRSDPAALPAVEYFRSGTGFSIGDIHVSAFTIPHDAADPVGFVLTAEGVKIGIATDLGYMPPSVSIQLRGTDALMIESNHDLEMLRDGPYPWSVKQRVLSRVGHLSNAAAAEFLERNYDGGAMYIILAHLSESNNLPELARISAEHALTGRMTLLGNRLVLASQHEPTESICF